MYNLSYCPKGLEHKDKLVSVSESCGFLLQRINPDDDSCMDGSCVLAAKVW